MKKAWIPIILFAVTLGVLFLPAVVAGQGTLLYGDDIHHQYYFYRRFFNAFIGKGIFPWWNPYNFSGAPFIADPIINIWYPANWIYTLVPLRFAYIFYLWFHLTLAGFGTYLLIRMVLSDKGISLPGIAGGFVFCLSGFFSARILAGHVDVIAAASYMPLVVLLFFRIAQKSTTRNISLAGLAFGLQLLSGYHTMGFFTLIVIGMSVIFFALKERSLRHMVPTICAVLLGLGLSAVSILPIQEFLRMSIRTIPRPYSWASYGSVPVEAFVKQLLGPFPYGNPSQYTGPVPNYFEHAFFFGRTTLAVLLAGFCMACFRKKRLSLWLLFFTIALFGAWMSTGMYGPVDLQRVLWETVPFYKMLRIPPRHLIFVVFGISVLAGVSLSLVTKKALRGIFSVLIIAELFWFARTFIEVRPVPEIRHDADLIEFLRKNTDAPFRILPNFGCWIPPREALDFDEPMTLGVFSATGYNPTVYRPYYDFIDAANGSDASSVLTTDVQAPFINPDSPAMNFLNIRYVLVPDYPDLTGYTYSHQFVPVKENPDRQYRLYENTSALGRFFFVPSARQFPSREAVAGAIRTGAVDFSREVALFEESEVLPPEECSKTGASVTVLSYTPNRIILHTSNSCDGYLVSSEVMYPGWTASVDGVKTPILTGNMAFRTLPVPGGEHTVEYKFVPGSAYIGGIISFVTLFIALFFVFSAKDTPLSRRQP